MCTIMSAAYRGTRLPFTDCYRLHSSRTFPTRVGSECAEMVNQNVEYGLHSLKFNSGPHNLGDPDDTTLRKVEKDVLIPQLIRDKAKDEKCKEEVAEFSKCCAANNVFMVVKCRNENSTLKSCLTKWFNDEKFKEECKQLYLQDRKRYRMTGVPNKSRFSQLKSS
ncbi:COX assembly mitochondrial protein homolog [Megalopta genalis]|uniref:COX assembly mitochondrial protein homolog n=1 Tax=Megalopta genalis TaxID=115081 RepID=UPI003FD22237